MSILFEQIALGEKPIITTEADLFVNIRENAQYYNLFTYSLYKNNLRAFNYLLDECSKKFPTLELGQFMNWGSTLQFDIVSFTNLFSPIEKKQEYLRSFIEKAHLSEQNKMTILHHFMINQYDKHLPQSIIEDRLIKPFYTYQDLAYFDGNDEVIQRFFLKYRQLNEHDYFLYFKDYMTHFEDYQMTVTFSNHDFLLDGFKKMVQEMDSALEKTQNVDDLKKLFLKDGQLAQIKEKYQPILDKFSEQAKIREVNVIYLFEDNYFNKYLIYSNSIGLAQSDKDIVGVIEDTFFNSYVNTRLPKVENEHYQFIKDSLSQYGFKGISISKFSNLEMVSEHIKEGSELVKHIYHLDDKEVGANNLYLKFTHLHHGYGGAASYTLGANIINHYGFRYHDEELVNQVQNKNQLSSHFLHEYTHYLQDFTYHPYELMKERVKNQKELYEQEDFGEISENLELKKATQSIYSYRVNLEDIFNSSLKLIKYYLPLSSEDTFKAIFDNSFSSEHYHEKTQAYLNSLTDAHLHMFNVEKFGKIIDFVMESLDMIKTGYQKANFYQTVWAEVDQKQGRIYLNNPFEIHARLVEGIANLPIEAHPQPYFYPVEKSITLVKPHLEKFNALLISNYRHFIDTKNTSNLKEKIIAKREKENTHGENLVDKNKII